MSGKKLMQKNSAYSTLVFFDTQDMALTGLELKNYLIHTPPSVPPPQGEGKAGTGSHSSPLRGEDKGGGEILSEIESTITVELSGKVEHREGLYFLRGRAELIAERKHRYQISLLRFAKTKKYLRFLRHLPYVRAVALSGSQALLNSESVSDIDLFIITKKNRIWLTRALVSAYFQLVGQRRYAERIAGRFCLNHYLADDTEITDDRNLYTAVEYASLLPVIGGDTLKRFWQKNQWIKGYLPNVRYERAVPFFDFRFSVAGKILELILDYTIAPVLNYLLGIYQKHRIRRQENILVSDNELSFHPGSHGQKVLVAYREALTKQ